MRREQTAVSCNLCVGQKHPPSASVFLADFSLLVPGGAQRIYLIRRVCSPLPPPQSPSLCCPFQTTSRPLLQAASLGRRGPEDMPAMPLSPYTGPQSQGALSSALCLRVCVGGSHIFCATRGLSLSLPPPTPLGKDMSFQHTNMSSSFLEPFCNSLHRTLHARPRPSRPSPELGHFSKEPWFWWAQGLGARSRAPCVLTAMGVLLPVGSGQS